MAELLDAGRTRAFSIFACLLDYIMMISLTEFLNQYKFGKIINASREQHSRIWKQVPNITNSFDLQSV
ncbi:hypothetical protein BDR06DRAFT_947315 [Suillus hirtellus]|nr:hypothetical protein BDR06DRAFT_947315 [Suillus hirtellus]